MSDRYRFLLHPRAVRSDPGWTGAAVLGVAVLVYGLLVVAYLPYGVDDAFISLAYARNLAAGKGLVFQQGAAPVEGYSNFLWVLLLAPIAAADADLFLASKVLSALIGAGCLLMLWRLASRFNGSGSRWNFLPVFLVAVSPIHTFWSAMGMETPLVTFLVLAFALRLVGERDHSRPWSSVLAWLLALARPEGVLFIIVGFLYRLAAGRRRHLRWALPFLILYGAYAGFRLAYFGQLLPNTFYAKTAMVGAAKVDELGRGFSYVLRFFRDQWHPALVVLAVLALVPPRGRRAVAALWALVLGQMMFAVGVGGDWMPNYRFLAPLLPCLFLLQQLGLAELLVAVRNSRRLRPVARWPLAVPIIAVLYLPCVLFQTPGRTVSLGYMASQGRAAGHGLLSYPPSWVGTAMGSLVPFGQILGYLDDAGAQGSTVAMQIVGYFAYEAGGRYRVLDTAGITDASVARLIHAGTPPRQRAEDLLARKPDYVWLTARSRSLDPFVAQYGVDGAIMRLPSFKRGYRHLATFGGTGHYQMLFGRVTSRRTRGGTSRSAPE